jgi:predicted nucleotidyltransferase
MIDRILLGLVDVFQLTFPNRIRSIYLVGSQAVGYRSATPTSDIDLRVIFTGDFLEGELDRFLKLRQAARERVQLRQLCEQSLAFENDYMMRYRTYLEGEMGSSDPGRTAFGRERLRELEVAGLGY